MIPPGETMHLYLLYANIAQPDRWLVVRKDSGALTRAFALLDGPQPARGQMRGASYHSATAQEILAMLPAWTGVGTFADEGYVAHSVLDLRSEDLPGGQVPEGLDLEALRGMVAELAEEQKKGRTTN